MIWFLILLAAAVLCFVMLCGYALGRSERAELADQLTAAGDEIRHLRAELDMPHDCPACAAATNPLLALDTALELAETWRDREIARRALDHPALYEAEIQTMLAAADAANPYGDGQP